MREGGGVILPWAAELILRTPIVNSTQLVLLSLTGVVSDLLAAAFMLRRRVRVLIVPEKIYDCRMKRLNCSSRPTNTLSRLAPGKLKKYPSCRRSLT